MKPKTTIFLSLLLLVLLAACEQVPDCDDRGAEELMARIVYTIAKHGLCDNEGQLGSDDPPIPTGPFPAAIEMSPRQAAITDMYFPNRMIARDREWLRPRIAAQIPERYRDVVSCGSSLSLYDFEVIRRAVKVRLADRERLPDRTENGRTYTKVCRAKLIIEPTVPSEKAAEAITLTYSLNSPSRISRYSKPGPLYIPINLFEATEPPLPFSLSDREKADLIRYMLVKPESQEPVLRIKRRAMRALRGYFENMEALPPAKPHPGIERTPPGKPDAIPHASR